MLKIKIVGDSGMSDEVDSCTVRDGRLGVDSTVDEFVGLFVRAMQGMSFSEVAVLEAMISYAEEQLDSLVPTKEEQGKCNFDNCEDEEFDDIREMEENEAK